MSSPRARAKNCLLDKLRQKLDGNAVLMVAFLVFLTGFPSPQQ